ncbi:MAG: cytochrome c oxidase subunit 2 [Myxococcota bacterium]|jgi:cytochrome c oxidase subunit 2
MIEMFQPQVSSFAGEIDSLILFVTVMVGFWYLLTKGMFFYLIFRFREKPGVKAEYITGKEKHLKRWVTIPHLVIILCDVFLIFGAVRVWYNVKQFMPEAQQTIRVVGQQWAWTFQHPGPDGELDTDDDISLIDELHIESGVTYHFMLESKDVLHNFSVPAFRLRQDAVPGRRILGWFKAEVTGEYDIQCAEMCGIGHGIMGAKLYVESPEQHSSWIRDMSVTEVAAATVREDLR